MATWHTVASIRLVWDDAHQIEDSLLEELLEVAKSAIIAYAPTPSEEFPGLTLDDWEDAWDGEWGDESENIPARFRVAQMSHTKNLWNAVRVGADGSQGGDTFEIQPRPLDWHVKQMLRPARGRYFVG